MKLYKYDYSIIEAACKLHGWFTRNQMKIKLCNKGWNDYELSRAFRRLKSNNIIFFSNQAWQLNPGWPKIWIELERDGKIKRI